MTSAMSSRASGISEHATTPPWLLSLLGIDAVEDGDTVDIRGQSFILQNGILRAQSLLSERQAQTSDAFGFKWHQRETFESPTVLARARAWGIERYGNVSNAEWWADYGDEPILLDAGCGAGMSALLLFEPLLTIVRYLGADVSDAVDVAAERFATGGHRGAFMQANMAALPLPPESVDVVFAEGVLHHTDSTREALLALTRLLRPGGRFLFYVYRRKGPIREFTDDHVREQLQDLEPEEAWELMMPLTELGRALGDLDIEIEVPNEISLLEIPAGRMNLQRLFYWHVFKAYYDPDLTIDELNHINFDWYAPRNAHRQTPEEVRDWCAEAGLEVERERIEEAGITVVARRGAGG